MSTRQTRPVHSPQVLAGLLIRQVLVLSRRLGTPGTTSPSWGLPEASLTAIKARLGLSGPCKKVDEGRGRGQLPGPMKTPWSFPGLQVTACILLGSQTWVTQGPSCLRVKAPHHRTVLMFRGSEGEVTSITEL